MGKIAIIGMGATGVSVLKAIAKFTSYKDDHIVLYNPPKTFGTGLPYQEDSEELLINRTADTMSLEADNPLDFAQWVKKEKGISNGDKEFFPRKWYGEYMKDKLASAMHLVQPKVFQEEVTSLRVQNNGKYIVQSPSSTEQYDSVHLCMGHFPYQDPYQLIGNERYIYHPYPVQEKLAHFPEHSRIGIIGTGLTGVDIMRFLKKQYPKADIYFFSRNGQFALYRGYEPEIALDYLTIENLREEKLKHNGFVPLQKMIEWFYLECQAKEVDFADLLNRFGQGSKEELNTQLQKETDLGMLQAIIHQMDFHLADFIQALTETDKEIFYRNYEPLFRHFRTPMPKASLEEVMADWNAGKVSVWDDMQAVEKHRSSFTVQLGGSKVVEVDYLVNATGMDMEAKPSKYHSDLMNQLLNERILQPEKFGGVQVIWPSAEAVSQRYGVLERLYVHGHLIQGIQYGNNAHMLMKQAESVIAQDAKRN